MTRFNNEAELSEWWEDSSEPWFAVRDEATDIYILSCNEDGDVFWTTMPNEEGDPATGWLREWKPTYPLYLLEYVPEADETPVEESSLGTLAGQDAVVRLRIAVEGKSLRDKVTIPVNTAHLILAEITRLSTDVETPEESAAIVDGNLRAMGSAGLEPDDVETQ